MATLALIKTESGAYQVFEFAECGFTSKSGEDVTYQARIGLPEYKVALSKRKNGTPDTLTITNTVTGVITTRKYFDKAVVVPATAKLKAHLQRGELLWQREGTSRGKPYQFLKTYEADATTAEPVDLD